MLKEYKKCFFCGSKNLKRRTYNPYKKNFYVDAIQNDLKISKSFLNKIKLYDCSNCYIAQHSPWFDEETSFKIFNNIYGQNNKSWSNLIKFINTGYEPNHGDLFKYLKKKILIKNYCEYNSPFKGLFINLFKEENKDSLSLKKSLFKLIIDYNNSRQLAGRTKRFQKKSFLKSVLLKQKMSQIKKKLIKKKVYKKYYIYDNSYLNWNHNDNYKSVNSKIFLNEMFNVNLYSFDDFPKKIKLDLFGIFSSLDHSNEPKKILNFALLKSKYVVISGHINSTVTKQHLFSLTNKFKRYLEKKNIFYIDLNKIINKKSSSPEIYLICSKYKKLINQIK